VVEQVRAEVGGVLVITQRGGRQRRAAPGLEHAHEAKGAHGIGKTQARERLGACLRGQRAIEGGARSL
jgi:hypothetical protein